jgi:hypothetical protein
MIVKDTDLRECPIKEVLRWVRVRNLLIMRKIAETTDRPKLHPLREILSNARHFDEILKFCVGSGRSLLVANSAEGKDAMVAEK